MAFWPAARRGIMKGFSYHALMLLALVAAGGCSFGRATLGDDIGFDEASAIKKGTSSRAEVVELIGVPDRIIQASGREILQYYRYDLKTSSLLLILLNFSRTNIKSDDLYVLLNEEGIVEDVLMGRRTDTLKFQTWPFGE
jgi:hypothetical protein